MHDMELVLAVFGALFAIVTMCFFVVWFCGELPKQRYREFLSQLTKHGSYESGSAPVSYTHLRAHET